MDTETGKLLDDHIEWAKFTGATWQGDGILLQRLRCSGEREGVL